MINVLVTGAAGQLGSEIRRLSSAREYNFFFTDVADLDILSYEAVRSYISEKSIDVVVNCAAYTAVDKAEEDLLSADMINNIGVKNIADACHANDATLIHISTDYVYDGTKHIPYIETDITNPLSVYGKTKLAGEQAVWVSKCKSIIIRTAWLYSGYGNNFVKTICRVGSERGEMRIIFDQIGTPTNAEDLACAILDIIPQILAEPRHGEIFHYSNEGVASWYDFAQIITKTFGIDCKIIPIESSEYQQLAVRPLYSVLNKVRIKTEFGLSIPHWQESLVRLKNRR
ncbi:MAG: dTDP-4-dehydrorhamnose reductase [Rikenellaceae bacterium]